MWNDQARKYQYFECSCNLYEHTFRLSHYTDDPPEETELMVDIYLDSHWGFFKRLWIGVKYAFGYKSRFGDFGTTLLNRAQANQMKAYIDVFLSDYDKAVAAEKETADTNSTPTEQ